MIGVVATIKVREGQNKAFEETARKLVAAVNANEPGNSFYRLYRKGGTDYVFLERYDNMAALDAHRASDHYKEIGGKMREYLDGSPDVQIYEEV